jgi:hypothetical protein
MKLVKLKPVNIYGSFLLYHREFLQLFVSFFAKSQKKFRENSKTNILFQLYYDYLPSV